MEQGGKSNGQRNQNALYEIIKKKAKTKVKHTKKKLQMSLTMFIDFELSIT